MARTKSGRPNGANGGTRAAKVAKDRRKQKVVLESVSKEKNQLRSVVRNGAGSVRGTAHRRRQITFRAEPPPGYTFIPAGNPQLTNALKEFARRGNHKILSVSTTPHPTRHELSREVHRIGFHFPTEVVSQVCAHYGIRLTSQGKLIDETKGNDQLFMKVYQKGQLVLDEKVQDQVTINTEAKQTITDLFPKIPEKDLFQIIKTAFQLGDGKVGTADEIPLVRRAQLSVVAHIRHVYTDYDKLLRKVQYNDARHLVEKDTLKKLVEWRGDDIKDDDDGKRAVDDLLDEVIVISDEEESESEEEAEQIRHEDLRVEELPTHAYGSAVPRPLSPVHVPTHDDAAPGYRFIPQVARRLRPSDLDIAARGSSRYAIWDQARQDYRSGASQPGPSYERILLRETDMPRTRLVPFDEPYRPAEVQPSRVANRAIEYEVPSSRPQSPRTYIRGHDGVLYEKVTTRVQEYLPPPTLSARRSSPPPRWGHISSRPESPRIRQNREHRRTASFEEGDGTILPSIEGRNGPQPSSSIRRNPFDEAREQNGMARHANEEIEHRPRREPILIDLTSSAEQPSKRRRLEASPPRYEDERQARVINPRLEADRSRMPPPPSYSVPFERRIIDLGEHASSPRARQYGATSRSQQTYIDADTQQRPLPVHLPASDMIDAREPHRAFQTSTHPTMTYAPVEMHVPGTRRVMVPEEQLHSFAEERVLYDTYGRRVVARDELIPLDRTAHASTYQSQSRMPLEVIPDQPYQQTMPRPPLQREYVPVSEPRRQPLDMYDIRDSSAQQSIANRPPAVLQPVLTSDYHVDPRYDRVSRTTYVQN